jgi:hypothetical protein
MQYFLKFKEVIEEHLLRLNVVINVFVAIHLKKSLEPRFFVCASDKSAGPFIELL